MSAFALQVYERYFRWLVILSLGLVSVYLATATYHWPLQKDAQVIHYINFLMAHGFAPYRNITDMNLPGAYMIEGWGMHLFGFGDTGWRLYDFALMGTMGVAMIVIAMPYDWLAGLFAGVLFALIHTIDGPGNTGERDEVMAVLIVIGFAFLFEAMRRRKPWAMTFFGLSLGMAGSVKPTVAPLGFVLLGMAWWVLRKRGEPSSRYLLFGLLGACIATAISVLFLVHYNAMAAFLDISRRLTPYYAALNHTSPSVMLKLAFPTTVKLLLPLALLLAFFNHQWKNWERWALLLGVAFGAASYFLQGKGYTHHRYPFSAFIVLWISIELALAMKQQSWPKMVGAAGLALGAFFIAPYYALKIARIHPVNQYTESIERDLASLGVDRLQRSVQCFDLVDGCLNALYHLDLIQSTGSTGDLLLFTPHQTPVTEYYRKDFWKDLTSNPPSVIVMSNEWWVTGADSFNKINEWPQFAAYLRDNYTLDVTRSFAEENAEAYQIYLRKDATFPTLR